MSNREVPEEYKTYQLKIQLLDIEPEIWRRILVPMALTLLELHVIIQGIMGWEDYHLHMFEISDMKFEVPESDLIGPEKGFEDERQQTLKTLLTKDMEFFYLYDYGDCWHHLITVEEVASPTIEFYFPFELYFPRCIAGARACPPEDCGGPIGYSDLLEKLRDPTHREHRDVSVWARGFQPEAFSITQANLLMRVFRALYKERGWAFL